MLEGFGATVMDGIAAEQARLRDKYDNCVQRGYQGLKKQEYKYKLVSDFKRFVLRKVEELEVFETQPCLIHERHCPRCPDTSGAGQVWIENVSPSCVHWSSQGTRHGWLGKENLPLIAWSISLRRRCPDGILLERTEQIDLVFVEELAGRRVHFYTVSLGPFDVGVPSAGKRVWACATAADGKLAIKNNPFKDKMLQDVVWRTVLASPAVWLFADEGAVLSYHETLNELRDKIPPHPRQKPYRPEDLIGSSYAWRLHCHRLHAAKVRNAQPEFLATWFYFDISQNVGWARKPNGTLPRQLCNGCIWIEDLERVMVPAELLAAQGLSLAHLFVCFFPCLRP